MGQIIKRGIVQAFNASMYTASVLLLEATQRRWWGCRCQIR